MPSLSGVIPTIMGEEAKALNPCQNLPTPLPGPPKAYVLINLFETLDPPRAFLILLLMESHLVAGQTLSSTSRRRQMIVGFSK
jgi:hypothetical protein